MRTILITGATTGIGRHAAIHLARRGHRVIATGRNASALESILLETAPLRVDTVQLDVTDTASIAAAASRVDALTEGRGLDVLINNAGYAGAGPLAEMADADLRAQFETNVFGLMAVTRAFLPKMLDRGAGRVLNVSSVSGRMPAPMLGAYHASKYALEALSDALRMELRPFGVEVVLIEPGTIHTDFAKRTMGEVARTRPDHTRYGPVYARADELRAAFARRASGPECVSRAIARAVEARRPAARYVAPARFLLVIALLNALPTRWVDALMCRVAGLTPDLLRPPPGAGALGRGAAP